jgi:hypothetical protein
VWSNPEEWNDINFGGTVKNNFITGANFVCGVGGEEVRRGRRAERRREIRRHEISTGKKSAGLFTVLVH